MSTLTTPAFPTRFAQAVRNDVAAAAPPGGRFAEAWRQPPRTPRCWRRSTITCWPISALATDLNDALSEPLWRDPTALLARRQAERRRSRRAAQAGRAAIAAMIRQHRPRVDRTGRRRPFRSAG